MEVIGQIASFASEINNLVEKVKANKKRCRRVCKRVNDLRALVSNYGEEGQTSADVVKALRELCITLKSARDFIMKYTEANWVKRVLYSSSHGDEFDSLNDRINDAFQFLSLALQLEQGDGLYKVFDLTARKKEDEEDKREDDTELKTLLLDYMKDQQEKIDAMQRNVEKLVELLDKPRVTYEDPRMIKPDELKYDYPKKLIMKTPTSEVYKGEYHSSTVAIKRYTDPVNTCLSDVRPVFDKEVQTMKGFESPNILRIFGICVQYEGGPNQQFLIIMEYCEKGSLREVLDSGRELSWPRKARMCLDAAQGLYRLHQTEEKWKVHGSINSSKFLVAEGYRVKLGGFELAKTETSLRRSPKVRPSGSLCYSSPQMLNDVNYGYSKECEVYSFGIVLWEVATRKKPFAGLTKQEIYQKVCKDKFQEPLPEDCPEKLGELINACREYDSFQRPSAGELVDRLRSVVAQSEE